MPKRAAEKAESAPPRQDEEEEEEEADEGVEEEAPGSKRRRTAAQKEHRKATNECHTRKLLRQAGDMIVKNINSREAQAPTLLFPEAGCRVSGSPWVNVSLHCWSVGVGMFE
jgi:hypothetical protein